MPIKQPRHRSQTTPRGGLNRLLREAKTLHRAAQSESLPKALPVLRRLIASNTLQGISLPELRRHQNIVQRKHILRMLAIEAGYVSWEEYRPTLANASADEIELFDIVHRNAGYPNVWFSSFAEARTFAALCGGRPLRVGEQAVVFAEAQDGLENLDVGRKETSS